VDADYFKVAVVSCDIFGHYSSTSRVQVARVAAINEIVASTIELCEPGDVVWLSGGDGGHIVFRQDQWQDAALRLIFQLRQWSDAEGVPLRITGHRGEIAYIRGADGRVQPVGQGINDAGWLLTQSSREGVVVSDAFRRGIESSAVEPPVEFHEPRTVPGRDDVPRLLFLMSTDRVRSSWIDSTQGDRAALKLSVRQDGGWDVLYFAKRIWQVHSADREVAVALESVKLHHLRYTDGRSPVDVNPFFAHLQPDELEEVLRLGQLVERKRGDVICRHGEAGDTMFVILRGQVGVYNSEGEGFDGSPEPKHVHRRGEIVGELAYALSRNRTADLVALSDVALLSFNNADLQSRMSSNQVGATTSRQVSTFVNYRVLQHVGDNAPYLLGPRRTGPLAIGPRGWPQTLSGLRKYCELITVDTRVLDLTLNDLPRSDSQHRGLCILAAGVLQADDVLLDGADFPVLWVDAPNLLPLRPRTYRVQDEPVKVLQIAAEGIDQLAPRQREALRKALPRAVSRRPSKHEFDVFLCHSKRDSTVVSEIRGRLTEAGITSWIDDEHLKPGVPVTQTIEQGLRSSRFLLACVSANFAESAWAQREFRTVLHLDVKRREQSSILLLMLNDDEDRDDVVPFLARDSKRVSYTRGREFESLLKHIASDIAN
jgi:hypothetical protein